LIGWRPAAATLWGWARDGVLVDGERVRLTTVKLGGRLLIRDSDLVDFLRATGALDTEPSPAA